MLLHVRLILYFLNSLYFYLSLIQVVKDGSATKYQFCITCDRTEIKKISRNFYINSHEIDLDLSTDQFQKIKDFGKA